MSNKAKDELAEQLSLFALPMTNTMKRQPREQLSKDVFEILQPVSKRLMTYGKDR